MSSPVDQLTELRASNDLWNNPKFVIDNIAGWITNYFPEDVFAIPMLIDELINLYEWYGERGEPSQDPLATDKDIVITFERGCDE